MGDAASVRIASERVRVMKKRRTTTNPAGTPANVDEYLANLNTPAPILLYLQGLVNLLATDQSHLGQDPSYGP